MVEVLKNWYKPTLDFTFSKYLISKDESGTDSVDH